MSKSTYSHWALDVLHVALLNQDFLCAVAQTLDVSVFDVVTFFKMLDPRVEIVG